MSKIKYLDIIIIFTILLNMLVPYEYYIVEMMIFLAYCIIKSRRLIVKTGADIWIFMFITILAIIMSIYNRIDISFYMIIRGCQYCLGLVIAIYIGVYLQRYFIDEKRLIQDIARAGMLMTIYYIGYLLLLNDFSFATLRENRVNTSIAFIASIQMIMYINNERIFSKKTDRCLLIGSMILSLFGFSRSNLMIILIAFGFSIISKARYKKYFINSFIILLVAILVFIGMAWYYADKPDTLIGSYINKLLLSLSELNSSQVFSSDAEISANWRGYEVSQAVQQFKKSNILQQVFGQGFRGVYVGQYSVYVGGTDGYLPLLHNGYFSVLTYSGIVGLVLYMLFYIKKIIYMKKNGDKITNYTTCIYMSFLVSYIVITFFINGMIAKSIYFIPGIFIGYMASRSRYRLRQY